MTSVLRCGICLALVAALFHARAAWTISPAGPAAMDAAGLVQKMREEIGKGLEAQATSPNHSRVGQSVGGQG
jgi:hypothetical protein